MLTARVYKFHSKRISIIFDMFGNITRHFAKPRGISQKHAAFRKNTRHLAKQAAFRKTTRHFAKTRGISQKHAAFSKTSGISQKHAAFLKTTPSMVRLPAHNVKMPRGSSKPPPPILSEKMIEDLKNQ
jgi:hypothetical protein